MVVQLVRGWDGERGGHQWAGDQQVTPVLFHCYCTNSTWIHWLILLQIASQYRRQCWCTTETWGTMIYLDYNLPNLKFFPIWTHRRNLSSPVIRKLEFAMKEISDEHHWALDNTQSTLVGSMFQLARYQWWALLRVRHHILCMRAWFEKNYQGAEVWRNIETILCNVNLFSHLIRQGQCSIWRVHSFWVWNTLKSLEQWDERCSGSPRTGPVVPLLDAIVPKLEKQKDRIQ